MLQFLCLQMCVYGVCAVPQGGLGDRHLVTVPQGVVGDRLPWGGERQGAGGVLWRSYYKGGGGTRIMDYKGSFLQITMTEQQC